MSSSRGAQLLTNVFAQRPGPAERLPAASLSTLQPNRPAAVVAKRPSPARRTPISDLHSSLHCSIIGTCLSSAELRRLLVRLKVQGVDAADDHEAHMLGVLLAARPQAGAKQLQKTLDRRHQSALNQFAKAKDAQAVAALWRDALKRGDIPGAYWALLTHPAATDTMVKEAFGQVHMLSHLVGAANRADIHRLRQLEEDNAALSAKVERQQIRLRDGFTSRDETIRALNDLLAKTASRDTTASTSEAGEEQTVRDALADLHKRLAQETSRRERLEQRLATAAGALAEADGARERAEQELAALRQELAVLESRLVAGERDGEAGSDEIDLAGMIVLYVGGRANQAPLLKGLVERVKGRFLHHDGGIEHSPTLLPGLVSRADIAMFPVDCVSHDAAAAVKRACQQLGKRYLPLRTSSLACLLSGLASLQAAPGAAAPS